MKTETPVEHFLKDYQAPDFTIDSTYLEFVLAPNTTEVTNEMQINLPNSVKSIELDGEQLKLLEVLMDGVDITSRCEQTPEKLIVPVSTVSVDGRFQLTVKTQISPQTNTALEGLYRTSGNYCTQCEAQGFRKITYYADRPDVLSLFTTKIIADKTDNAVLLSNGNLVEKGDLDDGQHYAIWHDPFKKPCYLFALVAGNLEVVKDHFLTADGRDVSLEIYVEPQNVDKCAHAMESLKRSMSWDETRFGLVYDLDIYMIVAVDDFNMGAMENKGLNVFNSKFVLAKPDTATDVDYEGIEAVIGHEYFHNWTGNRVTCRDWFQLTLKEGLTVFRDQEFTADMLSRDVKRIEDVKRLRSFQFPEDAGPMSHPIQPQSYIEMNNFYTMTVYEKGAEVVRMYHTLLGEAGFRKGMDLYFDRHDGQAVTIESFRDAMADANEIDLAQMHNWYVQHGTPLLSVQTSFNAEEQTFTLHVQQSIPKVKQGGGEEKPLLIPIKAALFSSDGLPVPLTLKDASSKVDNNEALLVLTEPAKSFTFTGVEKPPVLSFLRGFSAPVNLDFTQSDEELAILVSCDTDSFVCWESMQTLAMRELKRNITQYQADQDLVLSTAFKQAFAGVLSNNKINLSLKALTLTLPDLTYIGEQYSQMDVDAIYHVHKWLNQTLAETFKSEFLSLYQVLSAPKTTYRYEAEDIANRKLKNVCLKFLLVLPEFTDLAQSQFEEGQNMTDVLAALSALSHTETSVRQVCLDGFYDRWKHDPLVLDKWFGLQASSHHIHALEHVKKLVEHADFSYKNPNRVRSVLGMFGRINMLGFHRLDGAGYDFLAEQVIKLDRINPQVAARMVAPFSHWQHLDDVRQKKMLNALKVIIDTPELSKDVYEIVSKSLQLDKA